MKTHEKNRLIAEKEQSGSMLIFGVWNTFPCSQACPTVFLNVFAKLHPLAHWQMPGWECLPIQFPLFMWSKLPVLPYNRGWSGMVINPIVRVYIAIIRILVIKGGMTIPNINSLDPGTHRIHVRYIYQTTLKQLWFGRGFPNIGRPWPLYAIVHLFL